MEDFLINSRTYRIEKELGSGGGGTVFLAYHTRLQKYVVIKKMKSEAKSVLEGRAEADILKNLHHPNLPQVFDYVEEQTEKGESLIYTVMDFIPGDTLNAAFKSGRRFTQTEVVHYLSQLLDAVGYLHQQKPPIIHGDIKPSNIMLTPDDDIVLIDFNISSFSDTQEFLACTKEYAAPEQRRAVQENWARRKMQHGVRLEAEKKMAAPPFASAGTGGRNNSFYGHAAQDEDSTSTLAMSDDSTLMMDATETAEGDDFSLLNSNIPAITHIDERSDIFSIGASMYALLTGRRPNIDYGNRRKLADEDFPISEGLAYVIDKAMELNPDDRFQSVDEMKQALRDIGKKDKRYKRLFVGQILFSLLLVLLGAFSAVTAYRGYRLMQSDRAQEMYSRALELYQEQAYEEDLNYILMDALDDPSIYDENTRGNLYYLAANCFFEIEEYDAASQYYEQAVLCNDENAEYYVNYAISLVKQGKTVEAEQVIQMAESQGFHDAEIFLMKAELAASTGNTEEAEVNFRSSIDALSERDDAYLTARAYLLYSDLFMDQDEYEDSPELINRSIQVLDESESVVAASYLPLVVERRMRAYRLRANLLGHVEDYETACEAGQKLIDGGWASFDMYLNLASIREEMGDLAAAEKVLDEALSQYGENYIIFKRKAFLELLKQDAAELENRDYKQFADDYHHAVTLMKNAGVRDDADLEMSQLEEYYRSLVETGWLSEEAGE